MVAHFKVVLWHMALQCPRLMTLLQVEMDTNFGFCLEFLASFAHNVPNLKEMKWRT